jgi:hypothetical protein
MVSLKTDVIVTMVNNIETNLEEKKIFFVGILKANEEKTRIRIKTYGSGTLLKSKKSTKQLIRIFFFC